MYRLFGINENNRVRQCCLPTESFQSGFSLYRLDEAAVSSRLSRVEFTLCLVFMLVWAILKADTEIISLDEC